MKWEKLEIQNGGPGKRWGHTCNAVRGGQLMYIFGGYGEDNTQTNKVHVFDTSRFCFPPLVSVIDVIGFVRV